MSELQTLRDIHETIGLLLDTDPADLTPELRAELLLDLRKTILARGEKLDSIANVLLHLEENAAIKEASAAVYEAKAAKLRASASSFQRDAKRLGDYVLSVMAEMPKPKRGVRTLEGISSTFKAKSVADSVDVYDENLLEDKFITKSATLPGLLWLEIARWLGGTVGGLACWHQLSNQLDHSGRKPVKAEIKAALEKRVPCPECSACPETLALNARCGRCGGIGTIPATVPGGRLVTNKLRLEVS